MLSRTPSSVLVMAAWMDPSLCHSVQLHFKLNAPARQHSWHPLSHIGSLAPWLPPEKRRERGMSKIYGGRLKILLVLKCR